MDRKPLANALRPKIEFAEDGARSLLAWPAGVVLVVVILQHAATKNNPKKGREPRTPTDLTSCNGKFC